MEHILPPKVEITSEIIEQYKEKSDQERINDLVRCRELRIRHHIKQGRISLRMRQNVTMVSVIERIAHVPAPAQIARYVLAVEAEVAEIKIKKGAKNEPKQ
ncbi:MAG: hypothetical protein GY853_00830 [PVC group bacterium]|nr:hypothetical protein [PVC group bacterium]